MHGTKEIHDRVEAGVPSEVRLAPGPHEEIDGSHEFAGTFNSYIEFPNGGGLDVKNSMTMLCWVLPGGRDGPLFNYKKRDDWGVHLWVAEGNLFARFTRRDYSFTTPLMHTPLREEDGWRFVGASYDHHSGEAKLWVDGQVVQTKNIGTGFQLATQDSVRMGAKADDRNRCFQGRIAQMQVYNTALTREQIVALKDRTELPGKNAINLFHRTVELRLKLIYVNRTFLYMDKTMLCDHSNFKFLR